MEIEVKESSKKKLARSTWAGHVAKNRKMKHWQRQQMPRKWRGNGGEEDRSCDGDYIKSNLERVGKE